MSRPAKPKPSRSCDKAKANGFTGIKFYGTLDPAWLAASIAEAHKLGLHVHGHIPAGIRPLDAIEAGYDEITHINWVDDAGDARQRAPRLERNHAFRRARTVCEGRRPRRPAIKSDCFDDGEQTYLQRSDDGRVREPVRAGEWRTLSFVRAFRRHDAADDRAWFQNGRFRGAQRILTRADYRASWDKMVGLLGRMYRAGVPIVRGHGWRGDRDVSTSSKSTCRRASAQAEALAAATIVPARLVGQDARTGSIRSGKPPIWRSSTAIRRRGSATCDRRALVMIEGKLLDADALRKAAGFAGRPSRSVPDHGRHRHDMGVHLRAREECSSTRVEASPSPVHLVKLRAFMERTRGLPTLTLRSSTDRWPSIIISVAWTSAKSFHFS